ncbi:uncharacterized protein LOC111262107 [Varroa jacobsoni]|uniref:uncharacterized protein LOC111262107 n=1 Tax=Varroa jacobsoni TaxID=62625 RepID=UPI000BF786CE|nr:uncharacterized protein LOC111262107 [Varroa jacobsoni]
MRRRQSERILPLLAALLLLEVIVTTGDIARAQVFSGTSGDAEFLSAATKTVYAHDQVVKARTKKLHGDSNAHIKNVTTTTSEVRSKSADVPTLERQGAASNTSVANQVTTAISQFDLGLGYYKMCPFPFSYLHQCENSSECPGSDCCGMYAFPGPNRWRRSCCVPSSVTTIARVARLCIKSDKRPGVTGKQQLVAVNEVIDHVTASGDPGKGLHVPLAKNRRQQKASKSHAEPKQQLSVGEELSAEEIALVDPPSVLLPVTVVSGDDVIVLPEGESERLRANASDAFANEAMPDEASSVTINATADDDLTKTNDRTFPLLYFIKGIKKGWSSHTSIVHESIKHIHKLHDSLQPKLHDLVKAHLKGGAADNVCPVVRVYHKHCGRPCSTHKHCKDPHYACCRVICDDPWEKHSFKRGLYCHRMVEGKWMFDHSDPPQDSLPWGGEHWGWDSGLSILEMLMKQHKNKAPHHDSLGDKKVFLIG